MRRNKKIKILSCCPKIGAGICLIALIQLMGLLMPVQVFAQGDYDYVLADAQIENTAPSVVSSSIHLNDGATDDPSAITLTEGASTPLLCKFELNDPDGCEDIDAGIETILAAGYVYVYYSGAWTTGCYPDERNCYNGAMVPCTYDIGSCTGGADTTSTFTCNTVGYYYTATPGLRYYAQPSIDAGDWKCTVYPVDEALATGAPDTGSTPTEVNELLAFKVAGSSGTYPASDYINYGTINLGEISATAQQIKVTNTGNLAVDSDIKGSSANIPCDSGSIPVGNQNYSLSSGFTWYSATADSSTVFHTEDSNKTLETDLIYADYLDDLDGTTSDIATYWKLKMPSSLVGGSCSDSLVFTVKEST